MRGRYGTNRAALERRARAVLVCLLYCAMPIACGRETVDLLPGRGAPAALAGALGQATGSAGFRPEVGGTGPGYGAAPGAGGAADASGGTGASSSDAFGGAAGAYGFGGGFGSGCLSRHGTCEISGTVCDPVMDGCVPACLDDEDCFFRGICMDGLCQCTEERHCLESAAGRRCVLNRCVQCWNDSDCPSERPTCDLVKLVCLCRWDSECPPGLFCRHGSCAQ